MIKSGVNLLSIYGTTETGSLLNSNRDYKTDKAWNWIRPFGLGPQYLDFEDRGNNTFEVVVKAGYPALVRLIILLHELYAPTSPLTFAELLCRSRRTVRTGRLPRRICSSVIRNMLTGTSTSDVWMTLLYKHWARRRTRCPWSSAFAETVLTLPKVIFL